MNIIKRVCRKGNHKTMDTPYSTSQQITLTSSSLPRSCKKIDSFKIENLVKYPYVPDDAQNGETIPPLFSFISKRNEFALTTSSKDKDHLPDQSET